MKLPKFPTFYSILLMFALIIGFLPNLAQAKHTNASTDNRNSSDIAQRNLNSKISFKTSGEATTQTAAAANGVIREYWLNVSGIDVNSIPVNAAPSGTELLANLETAANWANDYGSRIRGFITAPQSGSYTFWIAGDDDCELWLSPGSEPANKTRIAFVNGWTNPREWQKYAAQKSAPITLTAGSRYYFEVLHKEGGGGDSVAVGWSQPGQSTAAPTEVVPGSVLSPFSIPNVIGEQARQADAFVESIGINVHLGYSDHPWQIYGRYADVIKPRLQELGVRHVRDGLQPTRTDVAAKLKDLYNTLGIKSLLITNPYQHTATQARDFVKNDLGVEKVEGIEGINEPDGFIGGCCWAQTTRDFQQTVYQTFKADAATAQLPFVGPSLATNDPNGNASLQLGDLSAFANFGNIHNYYGGRNPETNGWGDNGYGSLTWNFNYVAAPVTGIKPVFATETGYHNASETESGHKYTPESVVGRYMPRLLLSHFNRGVVESYPYELIDQGTDATDVEQNYGLLRYDNTAKPSFTALKNLIAILSDQGAGFEPSVLNYRLSGDTNDVQHTLLQKRDGRFYIALWVAAQRWLPDQKVETPIANRTVTMQLNSPMGRARTFLPLESADAIGEYANPTSLTLSVPDHPLIVELTPPSNVSNGTYRLIAEGSNKALDVWEESQENAANVVQYEWLNAANQKWRIEQRTDGYYRLTATHSNKVLEVPDFRYEDGANVVQYDWFGGYNQQWRIVPVGNGYYKLQPRHALDKTLEVAGNSTENGANVQIGTDNGSIKQRWRIEPVN